MTDPLRALFTSHLSNLTGPALSRYLVFNNLPESPVWEDDEGKRWTLMDRLVELMLTTRPTAALQRAFMAQLREESTFPDPIPVWNKADEDDKRARARLWLAIQRVDDDVSYPNQMMEDFGKRFSVSFAGKPAGWPASGWGEPGDGGWLAYALEELDASRARATPEGSDWSDTLAKWMDESLLGRSGDGRHRWWNYGSVAKAKKAHFQVGDEGWEQPNTLPNKPDWAFRNPTSRPLDMPAHWSRLMAGLLGRMADSLCRSKDLVATQSLYLKEVAQKNPLGPWMTKSLQDSLVELALAGLTSDPDSPHLIRKFDGRSLDALDILVGHDPHAGWTNTATRNQLAAAVLEHQRALEKSPHSHERAMARMGFSPAASTAFLWATAKPVINPPKTRFRS